MATAERTSSTHKVEVVSVALRPHPNADTLSIVDVYGYACCIRSTDWDGVSLGAYIPPDSLVDTDRPEFAFLKSGDTKWARIRAKKLRGVVSFGLLMPAPKGFVVGDDVASYYGVEHYEPALPTLSTGGEAEAAPGMLSCLSKYDVDSLRRYNMLFEPGEQVLITEKIHGGNSKFSWADDRMYCGSRTEWKREDPKNLWWRALAATPSIQTFCQDNPGHVLYGEVYGDVQSFKYGCKKGEVRFAAFDVLKPNGSFMAAEAARMALAQWDVPQVPLLAVVPYDFAAVCEYAEGPSTIPDAGHIREGCVVKPLVERWHQAIGRVQLKVVGAGYLEKGT